MSNPTLTLQSARSYHGETVRLTRQWYLWAALHSLDWAVGFSHVLKDKKQRTGMMDVDETVDSMNASKMIILPMGEKGGSVVISVRNKPKLD